MLRRPFCLLLSVFGVVRAWHVLAGVHSASLCDAGSHHSHWHGARMHDGSGFRQRPCPPGCGYPLAGEAPKRPMPPATRTQGYDAQYYKTDRDVSALEILTPALAEQGLCGRAYLHWWAHSCCSEQSASDVLSWGWHSQASVRLSRLARQGTASFAAELSPLHDHLALTPVRAPPLPQAAPAGAHACCAVH